MNGLDVELKPGVLALELAVVEPGNVAHFEISDNEWAGRLTDTGVMLRHRFDRRTVFYPWSSVVCANHKGEGARYNRAAGGTT